jgi:hypothetical protein
MRLVAAGLVLILAASCGPKEEPKSPEHAALLKVCKDGGTPETACTCIADKTDELLKEEKISPEMYRALVLQAEGKVDESNAIMETMDIHQKFAQVTAVGEVNAACAAGS